MNFPIIFLIFETFYCVFHRLKISVIMYPTLSNAVCRIWKVLGRKSVVMPLASLDFYTICTPDRVNNNIRPNIWAIKYRCYCMMMLLQCVLKQPMHWAICLVKSYKIYCFVWNCLCWCWIEFKFYCILLMFFFAQLLREKLSGFMNKLPPIGLKLIENRIFYLYRDGIDESVQLSKGQMNMKIIKYAGH